MAVSDAQTMAFCSVPLYHYPSRSGRPEHEYRKLPKTYAKATEQTLDLADILPDGNKGNLLRSRAGNIAQHVIELLPQFALEACERILRKNHLNIARRVHNNKTRLLRTIRHCLYGALNR